MAALPDPIPDNPLRWDGWRSYNSPDFYERLCLCPDASVGTQQIEDNCRQLLVWWQKKLPLKNQPSNPLAQLLRSGLDEAPILLAEARTGLLNPEARARIDADLHAAAVQKAVEELKKIVAFALIDNQLSAEAEMRLERTGADLGLLPAEFKVALDAELLRLGSVRLPKAELPLVTPVPASVPVAFSGPTPVPAAAQEPGDIFAEFRRMLRLSKLCLDGDDMTDDQRDALCNMGESLGLTGGQAEDIIDEYLETAGNMPVAPSHPATPAGPVAAKLAAPAPKPLIPAPSAPGSAPAPGPVEGSKVITPLMRQEERRRLDDFSHSLGGEMLLVTSGSFLMGSDRPNAADAERPVTPVTIRCFFMSRFAITNAQYEIFDPAHLGMRAPWSDDSHPVVYVNSFDAERFCHWLSQREGRKYRLPTEAEWEYAARGTDARTFPWGEALDSGERANFADRRSTFGWKDTLIDDGFAESAPVGSYPKGASSFGIEDLSGNVFEWCLDYLETYKGKERVNPRGPIQGTKRVYRGGSWKSRALSLRGAARHFNTPEYASNDVGFRVVCEPE